jgi:hypothetical protein
VGSISCCHVSCQISNWVPTFRSCSRLVHIVLHLVLVQSYHIQCCPHFLLPSCSMVTPFARAIKLPSVFAVMLYFHSCCSCSFCSDQLIHSNLLVHSNSFTFNLLHLVVSASCSPAQTVVFCCTAVLLLWSFIHRSITVILLVNSSSSFNHSYSSSLFTLLVLCCQLLQSIHSSALHSAARSLLLFSSPSCQFL